MAVNVTITSPGAVTRGRATATGQAYDSAGHLLRAGDLAEAFDAIEDDARWQSATTGLNGCFAVIRSDGVSMRASVDRIRSFPLFFAGDRASITVSDNAADVRRAMPEVVVDELSQREFALTGYVTGSSTLLENLQQVRAGHWLSFGPRAGPVQRPYYALHHGDFFDQDRDRTRDRLVGIHERVFRRLTDDVAGRQIMLPLSGGYDSRLIGVMLRDLGYRDVLCFCYGNPDSWETEISRKVAEHLGYRWTMIPYSASGWQRVAATPAFDAYFRQAGNLVSLPHVQDWPAVETLVGSGEVREGAVFVPGHTGDFLTGNHIPKWYPRRTTIGRDEILRSILEAHYSLWDPPADGTRDMFRSRIDAVVGPVTDSPPEVAADVYERWEWQERQAKFIVNSVRVYEAFGFEWRVPWWDHELMDFWSRVPISGRVGRSLYLDYVARHQTLPVTQANTDHSKLAMAAIGVVNRTPLRPLAKRAQRAWQRFRWRWHYEHDPMRWFALVEPAQFRERYTGRESGHSFLALQYLDRVLP